MGQINEAKMEEAKKEAQMKVLAANKINKHLMDAFQNLLDNKKDGEENSDLYNNIKNAYVEAMNAQTPSEFVMHMRHLSDACVNYVDHKHPISQEGKERKKIVKQLHQVVEEEIMPEINEKLDTFEVIDKDKVIGEIDKEFETDTSKDAQMKVWAATKINKNLMDAFQDLLDNKRDGKANSDLYNNIKNEYIEAMNAQTPSEFVMHMRHLSDACVKYADSRHPISQEGKERKKIVQQLHQVVEKEILPEITKKLDTFEVVDKDNVIDEMAKEGATEKAEERAEEKTKTLENDDTPLVEKTSFNDILRENREAGIYINAMHQPYELVDKDEVEEEMETEARGYRKRASFYDVLDEEGINTAGKTTATPTDKGKSTSNTLNK